jgi:hypothetical protein
MWIFTAAAVFTGMWIENTWNLYSRLQLWIYLIKNPPHGERKEDHWILAVRPDLEEQITKFPNNMSRSLRTPLPSAMPDAADSATKTVVVEPIKGPNSQSSAFPNYDYTGMTKAEYAFIQLAAAHVHAHGSIPLKTQLVALAELSIRMFDIIVPGLAGWPEDEFIDPDKVIKDL